MTSYEFQKSFWTTVPSRLNYNKFMVARITGATIFVDTYYRDRTTFHKWNTVHTTMYDSYSEFVARISLVSTWNNMPIIFVADNQMMHIVDEFSVAEMTILRLTLASDGINGL